MPGPPQFCPILLAGHVAARTGAQDTTYPGWFEGYEASVQCRPGCIFWSTTLGRCRVSWVLEQLEASLPKLEQWLDDELGHPGGGHGPP